MRRRKRELLLAAGLLIWPSLGSAQGLPPADVPDEFRIPIEEMTFEQPTTIEARVLYLDTYDEALWVEWLQVQEKTGWRRVPDQRQFILYPRDAGMLAALKGLPKGTVIRLHVQRGPGGKRMILDLDEL